ncbi:MAG TPA: TerC family protein [Anaeromyxobacteraceae bacterium]|nr:TerC family protein [Anaeromyxobacteraceae bacterium]
MIELLSQPATYVSLLTLAALEIVLGIDNVVFLTILAGRLPKEQQGKARQLGLAFALVTRVLLLFAISWVMGLTRPLFSIVGQAVSGRDLILLVGGLFLIGKATFEIHDKLEVKHEEHGARAATGAVFWSVIVQIGLLDIVFSLDSVITAVGMAEHLSIMVAAVVVAMGVMLAFANPIGEFVERHPTMKMLALSFLILIGVMLVAEAFHQHVPKGYIYFAMAFSLVVELLNMRMRKASESPVKLHHKFEEQTGKSVPGV